MRRRSPSGSRESRHRRRSRSPERPSRSSSGYEERRKRRKAMGLGWDALPGEGGEVEQIPQPEMLAQARAAQAMYSGSGGAGLPRPLRRLYVGNIDSRTNEEELLDLVNSALEKSGIMGNHGPYFTSCSLHWDKFFAFIEANTPEEATLGLKLDGLILRTHKLKFRRPRDYKPVAGIPEHPPPNVTVPGIVATDVVNQDEKLFVGGVPAEVSETDLQDILLSVGKLRAFNIVKDSNTNQSKGYAFAEYWEREHTDRACEVLNGTDIGGKRLCVQRASIGARRMEDPVPQVATGANATNVGGGHSLLADLAFIQKTVHNPADVRPEHAVHATLPFNTVITSIASLQEKEGRKREDKATRVVCLWNIVGLDTVDHLDSVVNDIREQMKKYSKDRMVRIHAPLSRLREVAEAKARSNRRHEQQIQRKVAQDLGDNVDEDRRLQEYEEQDEKLRTSCSVLEWELCCVPVYVEYESKTDSALAVRSVAGMTYRGHVVITSYADEDEYKKIVSRAHGIDA